MTRAHAAYDSEAEAAAGWVLGREGGDVSACFFCDRRLQVAGTSTYNSLCYSSFQVPNNGDWKLVVHRELFLISHWNGYVARMHRCRLIACMIRQIVGTIPIYSFGNAQAQYCKCIFCY